MASPSYRLRINGDDSLVFPGEHTEKVDDAEFTTRDEFDLPLLTDRITVEKLELVDEAGEAWAMRRLPPGREIHLTREIRLSVRWAMSIGSLEIWKISERSGLTDSSDRVK